MIEEDLILNLLESRAKVSAASQASKGYFDYSQRVPRQVTGVHVAAYFGLVEMIISLLKKEYNPDLQDSYGRTPLLLVDWPRSGPVRTVAFFGDRLKRLDCTVQHLRTAVRSQKYWTGPFGPVFLLFENGDR